MDENILNVSVAYTEQTGASTSNLKLKTSSCAVLHIVSRRKRSLLTTRPRHISQREHDMLPAAVYSKPITYLSV